MRPMTSLWRHICRRL